MATAAGTQNGIVTEAAKIPNVIVTAAAGYPLIKTFRGKEGEDVERFLKNVSRYNELKVSTGMYKSDMERESYGRPVTVSRSCLTSPCCSTGNIGCHGGLLPWQYPTLPYSSARPAWSRCGIRLRCGGIRLRPNLCRPGVVSLRYSTSLWRYPTSP